MEMFWMRLPTFSVLPFSTMSALLEMVDDTVPGEQLSMKETSCLIMALMKSIRNAFVTRMPTSPKHVA